MKRSDFYKPAGEYPYINENIIARLEELFDFVPPEKLNKSLRDLLMHYLMKEDELLPENFHNIITDVYAVMKFLDHTGEELDIDKNEPG